MTESADDDARRKAAAFARDQQHALEQKLVELITQRCDVIRLCKPLDEHAIWKQAADALEVSHV